MTTPKEKSECVWWYVKTELPITIERQFRQKYERDSPFKSCVIRWAKNFQESGSVMDLLRSGQSSVSEEIVGNVQTVFQRSFSIS